MRWGTRWGKTKDGHNRPTVTFWGGDRSLRQTVRLIRGRIFPCEDCNLKLRCDMYVGFTRHRLRTQHGASTNLLHTCDAYVPKKSPGSVKAIKPNPGPGTRS